MRMRNFRWSIKCAALWLLVVSCGPAARSLPVVDPGEQVSGAEDRVTPAMAADIDEFAAQILATNIVPGMGLAVVTSSGIAYAKGYGFANVESQASGHRRHAVLHCVNYKGAHRIGRRSAP